MKFISVLSSKHIHNFRLNVMMTVTTLDFFFFFFIYLFFLSFFASKYTLWYFDTGIALQYDSNKF